METESIQNSQKNRFKLSLKKSRLKGAEERKKRNRSSDVIILDDSSEAIRSDFPKRMLINPKIYSPIVIVDSDEASVNDDPPEQVEPEPSKAGNVSFTCSNKELSIMETGKSRPSIAETWSPSQNIIRATPKQNNIPSTPRDEANESLERCSMKQIEMSRKKLLDDLYGQNWRSIPNLFKSATHKHDYINSVTKKLQFNDDEESDKENIKQSLKLNKELYLTASDTKLKLNELDNTEKKSKKKLYTEKVPSTPDVVRQKPVRGVRNANTTVKKNTKAMSVTELVEVMKSDLDVLTKKVQKVAVSAPTADSVKRLSFLASLADNIPSWRCHIEAIQYVDSYKTLYEQLARRLYTEFNKGVFDDALDADMPIIWDTKLRSTAGTTTNRLVKTSRGVQLRTSSIKLSTKVVDGPQRLRDTMIHELCHAATWLIDGEIRAGHGPLWKKWANRALHVYPELGEISRCHDLEIHFKYSYRCTKCGYSIQRHSKSIDVTKKCCGYCRGTFEVIVNKKKKDGVIVSTPAGKRGPNDFALYVKENYASVKSGRTHAQVMKVLGEQFSARKNQQSTPTCVD